MGTWVLPSGAPEGRAPGMLQKLQIPDLLYSNCCLCKGLWCSETEGCSVPGGISCPSRSLELGKAICLELRFAKLSLMILMKVTL